MVLNIFLAFLYYIIYRIQFNRSISFGGSVPVVRRRAVPVCVCVWCYFSRSRRPDVCDAVVVQKNLLAKTAVQPKSHG